MEVRHPQYGVGVVKALSELTADISFDDARRTIAPARFGQHPAHHTTQVRLGRFPAARFFDRKAAAEKPWECEPHRRLKLWI